jgi:two-component system response regulator DesR
MELRDADRYASRGLQGAGLVVGIIASDYMAVRRVARVLRAPGFDVAALACEIPELLLEASGLELDVVVFYPDGGSVSGGVAELRKRLGDDVGLVAILGSAKPRDLRRALDAGADGIVIESQLQLALALTVRTVSTGQLSIPREARVHVHGGALSYRERLVLTGVTAGLTNREISARLQVSQSTVKSHLSSAFGKLGVRTREEAAAALLEDDAADSRLLGGVPMDALTRG